MLDTFFVSYYNMFEGEIVLDLHSNLKEVLDGRNLSIRQVARDIDYRFATVRQMYNDEMKHYPKDLIGKLCEYLDVGISDLLKLKDESKTAE